MRFVFGGLWVSLALGRGGSGVTAGMLPGATRLGRAALRVADLEEEVGFYRNVVGRNVVT